MTARELSQVNAYRKARAVAKKFPDALVLGADTLVYLDTTLFGKPATLEEAYQMLERLQGRTHQVVTGICLLHLRKHRQAVFAESTAVTFHPLDEVKIRRYLNRVNPLDKAGAYAIQEEGDLIVEKIVGSYTNVVGLAVERLTAELAAWARREDAGRGPQPHASRSPHAIRPGSAPAKDTRSSTAPSQSNPGRTSRSANARCRRAGPGPAGARRRGGSS